MVIVCNQREHQAVVLAWGYTWNIGSVLSDAFSPHHTLGSSLRCDVYYSDLCVSTEQ